MRDGKSAGATWSQALWTFSRAREPRALVLHVSNPRIALYWMYCRRSHALQNLKSKPSQMNNNSRLVPRASDSANRF